MRDLLVTAHTPALGSGHGIRTYAIARALARHRGVDLLYVRFGAAAPDPAFQAIGGVQFHPVESGRGLGRALAYLRARAGGVPPDLARGISSELIQEATLLSERPDRGRIVADGPTIAAALSRLAGRRPVIYSASNLESGFRHDLSRAAALRAGRLRSFERRLLERMTESWMVSSADMQAALELCPAAALRYVPNVVDVAAIAPVGASKDPNLLFIGSLFYKPNLNGLRFLLADVMPLVWKRLPEATLTVAGTGLKRPISEDKRVRTLGYVESLAEVYAGARAVVVPLLQGGGTPLKLIEALAFELPVVATPRAVRGLEVSAGVHCEVAEGATDFAEAILRVMSGDATDIARRGRELAAEKYSIEVLERILAP